jgi:hypothetical protein
MIFKAIVSARRAALGGIFEGIVDMTGRAVLPPKIYALAVASLTDAALGMAEDKNVAVTVKQCVGFASAIVEVLDASTVYQLTECDPEAAAKAAAAINRLLDVCAASQVLRVLEGMDGFERLDQSTIIAEANAWMRDITANDAPGQRFRWPDPVEMAKAYFRARSSGPVSITFPNDRGVRAGYFLDRASASVKTDSPGMSTPLLTRCPAMGLRRELYGKRVKETAQ